MKTSLPTLISQVRASSHSVSFIRQVTRWNHAVSSVGFPRTRSSVSIPESVLDTKRQSSRLRAWNCEPKRRLRQCVQEKQQAFWTKCSSIMQQHFAWILRKFQHTPGTHPRPLPVYDLEILSQICILGYLGDVPAVCWNFLRSNILDDLYYLDKRRHTVW